MAYPGEAQHLAYQDYVLDHATGDAPGNGKGRRMTKKEWVEYTKRGENKTAGAPPAKPSPTKPVTNSPMSKVYAE